MSCLRPGAVAWAAVLLFATLLPHAARAETPVWDQTLSRVAPSVVTIEIDQARARALGVSSQDVALTLQGWLVGATVTQFRERDKLIDVVLRGAATERAQLSFLKDLAIPSRNGKAVPITQIADVEA